MAHALRFALAPSPQAQTIPFYLTDPGTATDGDTSKRLGRFDLPAVIPIVTVQEPIGGMLATINPIRQGGTGK